MTNYYCSASVGIPYDTEEEHDWLVVELGKVTGGLCIICGLDDNGGCECEDGFAETPDPGGFVFEDQSHRPVFNAETAKYDEEHVIWVQSEEYIIGDVLVDVVARYQRAFNRTDFWEMQTAYTASRPVADAYGGYGVLVYKGQDYWFCPHNDTFHLTTQLMNLDDYQQTLPYCD